MIGSGELQEYPQRYDAYARLGKSALYVGPQNVIGPTRQVGVGITKIPRGYEFIPRPRSERSASSIIDELRVSDEVLYRRPFSPPTSFAPGRGLTKPALQLSTRELNFLVVADGRLPAPATIDLAVPAAGQGELAWSAKSTVKWIRMDQTSGMAGRQAQTIQVSVDPGLLWPNFHQGKIAITSPNGTFPEQTIEVNVLVESDGTTTWLMDERLGAPLRFQLEDESVNGYDLTLGPGGRIIPGLVGNALDPRGGRTGHAAIRRYIDQTHHNLGPFDWTWQCWLRLDQPAREGDVLFMLRENVAIGPYPFLKGVGKRCALVVGPGADNFLFINDASGLAGVPLKTDGQRFQGESDEWFHLALGYDSSNRTLLHWINGQLHDRATLAQPLRRLPPTGENVLSLGKTVAGKHPWPGLIDEVRLGAEAPANSDFSLPPSDLPRDELLTLDAGPHLFFDDHLIAQRQNLTRSVCPPEYPVPPPNDWDLFLRQHPNHGDTHMADLGPHAPDPNRRFLRYSYVHSYSAAEQRGGIYCYYGPSLHGPWIENEHNPVLNYVWAGQPHARYSVSDHWPVMFDPATRQLVMFFKTYPLSGEHPELSWYRDERFNYQNRVISGFRRHQGIAFSTDGLHWSNPQHVFVPDDDDYGETQFQTPMLSKRGDLYLALIQHLRDDVDRSVAWASWASSRDLYHWHRQREPFIDFGREAWRGDKVIRPAMNDEIYIKDGSMVFSFSVTGSHKPPRAAFPTFARLPVDRFASLSSRRGGGGRLRTKRLLLDGDIHELQINCKARETGEIRVQIVDERDQVVPGFGLSDCDPIGGDHLKRTVTWRGSKSLDAIQGQTIRLEFSIRDGSLFAFYLIGPGWQGEKDYSAAAAAIADAALDERPVGPEIDEARVFELLEIDAAGRHAIANMDLAPRIVQIRHALPAGYSYPGDPPPAMLTITPSDQSAGWSVEENIRWLTLQPRSGRGRGKLNVQVHGLQLGRGDYLGKFSIRLHGRDDTIVQVPVHFQLQ